MYLVDLLYAGPKLTLALITDKWRVFTVKGLKIMPLRANKILYSIWDEYKQKFSTMVLPILSRKQDNFYQSKSHVLDVDPRLMSYSKAAKIKINQL